MFIFQLNYIIEINNIIIYLVVYETDLLATAPVRQQVAARNHQTDDIQKTKTKSMESSIFPAAKTDSQVGSLALESSLK